MSETIAPSKEELLSYFDKLSNWGRWGDDDQLGTLNLITPKQRLAASQLVTRGVVVPLGMDLDPENPDPVGRGTLMERTMAIHDIGSRLRAVRETITMMPHGSATHLDALSHFGWDGKMYNGFPFSSVNDAEGATKLSVHTVHDGIVTRGVLLDIAGLQGVDWLEPGTGPGVEELEAAEERQGVRVKEGDVLIIHTGSLRRIREQGPDPDRRACGYHPSCLPWLHERGVALLTSDALNDIQPSAYGPKQAPSEETIGDADPEELNLILPVHTVALVAMGLWLIDNIELNELLPACQNFNQWEFLISISPLRWVGATASQVNPLAMF